MEELMFCAYCDELIKGNSYIYDGEEYCSRECFLAAQNEIEGEIDKYREEWEQEIEEDY